MHSLMEVACMAVLATSVVAETFSQLWNFTDYFVDIENGALRDNGKILLTTFSNASLWSLDPSAAVPVAELVMNFPGITAIGGIAQIGDDKFAISMITGGIRGSYLYTNETIFIIEFASNDTSNATISSSYQLPDPAFINGLVSLPAYPHIVLAGDSNLGCIFRINTSNGSSEVVFADPAFAFPTGATVPIGLDGLKIFDGYAYFTNVAQNTFGRVPISDMGDKTGDVEILASIAWDDFVIDLAGIVYGSESYGVGSFVLPDGPVETVLNSTAVHGGTSVMMTPDKTRLYLTTRGETVSDVVYSGQVVEIGL